MFFDFYCAALDEIDGLGEAQNNETEDVQDDASQTSASGQEAPSGDSSEGRMAAAEADSIGNNVSEHSDLLIKHMDVISDAIPNGDEETFNKAVNIIKDALVNINTALQGIPNTDAPLNGLQDATSSYITASKSFFNSPDSDAYAKRYTDTQRDFSAALKQLLFQVTRRNRLVGRSLSRGFSKRSLTQNLRAAVMNGGTNRLARDNSGRSLNTTPPSSANNSSSNLNQKSSSKSLAEPQKSTDTNKSPRIEPGVSATAEDAPVRSGSKLLLEGGPSAGSRDFGSAEAPSNNGRPAGVHARRPSRSISSIDSPSLTASTPAGPTSTAKPTVPPKPASLQPSLTVSTSSIPSPTAGGASGEPKSPRDKNRSPRGLEREHTIAAPKTKEARDPKDKDKDSKFSSKESGSSELPGSPTSSKKKDKKEKEKSKEKKASKKGDLTSSRDTKEKEKKGKLSSSRSSVGTGPNGGVGVLKRHKTLHDDVGTLKSGASSGEESPRFVGKLKGSAGTIRDSTTSSDSDADSSMSNTAGSALAVPSVRGEMHRINSSELLGEISSRKLKKEDTNATQATRNGYDAEGSLIDDSRDEEDEDEERTPSRPVGRIRPSESVSHLTLTSSGGPPGTPLTPQKRSVENDKQQIANRIIQSFCERFPSFKTEWESADPMKKVLTENKIVSELAMYQITLLKMQPAGPSTPGPSGAASPASTPPMPAPSSLSSSGGAPPGIQSLKMQKMSAKEKSTKSLTNVGTSSSPGASISGSSPSGDKKPKKVTTPNSLRLWSDDKSPTKESGGSSGSLITKSGSPGSARGAQANVEAINDEQLDAELMRIATLKNPAEYGTMTMRLKGSFMSLLGMNSSASAERAVAPTKLPETVLNASRSFCSSAVISFLEDVNTHTLDPTSYVGEKSTQLGEKQLALVETVKTMINGLRTLVNIPAGSAAATTGSSVLADMLNRIEDEAAQPREGTLHEIDPKLLTECRYGKLVRHNIVKSITRWSVGIYHTAGQIGTDVVALSKVSDLDSDCEATVLHLLSMISAFFNLLSMLMNDLITLHYAVVNSGAGSSPPAVAPSQSPRYPSISIVSTSNPSLTGTATNTNSKGIWNEPEPEPVGEHDKGPFRTGSLNQLVLRLLTSGNESYVETFIDTYSAFTTASAIIDLLIEAVTTLSAQKFDSAKNIRILASVCDVLERLIRAGVRYHFDDTCTPKIRLLLGELAKTKDIGVQVQKLMALIANREEEEDKDQGVFMDWPREVQTYELESSLPHTCILLFDATTIAQQLTYIEFDIFKNITPDELKNQSWNKTKRMCVARNVCALIRRANRISMWVATTILLQPKVKDRARVILKVINVAKALKEVGNYNTLMGIIAGLNMACISRLKLTMAAVGRKPLDTLRMLQNIVDPTSSFKTLRETLRQGGASQLPYIGTTLTDLTFIDDGNPDFLTNPNSKEEVIHMEKHSLLSNCIRTACVFQASDFKITLKDPPHTFLHELPCLDESLLYKLSLEREPRTNETFKKAK